MKDFWDVIRERRSVRAFAEKPVPKNYIEKILKAAVIAPSGSNKKNWMFLIVKNRNKKEELKNIVMKKIMDILQRIKSEKAKREFKNYSKYFTFFSDAPVVIAVIKKPYDSLTARILNRYTGDTKYESSAGIQGVSAAIENMLLAVAALGLGACWMTGPLIAKEELEDYLGIKHPDCLVALVPIGFPKQKPRPNKFPDSVDGFAKCDNLSNT